MPDPDLVEHARVEAGQEQLAGHGAPGLEGVGAQAVGGLEGGEGGGEVMGFPGDYLCSRLW